MNLSLAPSSLLILFVLLLSSCSTDKRQEKLVDSRKIIPQAKGEYDYPEEDTSNKNIPLLDTFQLNLKAALPSLHFTGAKSNPLYENNSFYMPNQMSYTHKLEYFFFLDSVPYHFIKWHYKDSLHAINSFYNWLDCFNRDCRSIRINEEINGSENAFLLYVSNEEIVYLESSNRLQRKYWENHLLNKNKSPWNFIIYQPANGRMNWIKTIKLPGEQIPE